jgi:hypothetical protein
MSDMTTTEATGAILTLNDVKALRQCDQVSISHTGEAGFGEGTIRCIKKLEQDGPFSPDEREYRIVCESRVTNYIGDGIETDGYNVLFRCRELLYNYSGSSTEIGSLAMILKVGDELSLKWIGSRNGYTREANLHMDSLNIEVKRGNRRMTFMMSQHVSPDNTARMIQRRSY